MTAGIVLVLSGPDDATADSVVAELVGLSASIVRMDIGDFPLWMAMTAWLTHGTWRGELLTADQSVDLAEVGSVYYRRPTRFTFEDDMSDADEVFAGAEAQFGVGGVLAALDGVLWVNNPARVAFAEYKPVQLRAASDCGLQVPRTLVTNDHSAAREFAAAVGGKIVCKTLSSLVLSESGQPRITYTTPIDPATVDPLSLAATAHLLQEWVPKRYDARVTMVGHRPFAVAIHADNDAARIDWRADYNALTYAPLNPPEHIVTGMMRYLHNFGLEFGAFDFTVTPRGEWVFLVQSFRAMAVAPRTRRPSDRCRHGGTPHQGIRSVTGWQCKARTVTQQLTDAAVLDRSWRAAFENTPRHTFVPRFYRHDMTVLDGSDPEHHREWLDAVYSDDSLPTRYAPVPGTALMWPTSSSTKPSLMACMLTLLDVHSGHRVMEIGTGTGYNTALLCHRLGDGNVASIDIDPDLVSTARAHLTELGYRPNLVTGDGAQGLPDAAPFDRIIATCAVPAVPRQWITQLREGGIIVTDLRGDISSNLTVFHKINPTAVEGRVLTIPGHFMWLRPRVDNPLRDGDEFVTTIHRDDATKRLTQLDPGVLDHPDLRFLLQLREPTIQAVWRVIRDGTELMCVHARDGAWAEADVSARYGRHAVTQGGRRRIWDQIEHIAALWTQLGRPSADRFGLTVTADEQRLWLDTPESTGLVVVCDASRAGW